MINWLYQTNLEVSIIIGIILLIRKPVRALLGSHVVYWLWAIPFIRFVSWFKAEIPSTVFEQVNFPNGKILIRIFDNPDTWRLSYYFTLEKIWIGGVVAWIILRVLGWIKFKKHLKDTSSPMDIYQHVNDIEPLKNLQKVSFFNTTITDAPFITGIFKAQIYLPKNSFKQHSQQQKMCILKHEMTHLNRKDLWAQIAAEIMRTLFWFNPVIHIAYHLIRQDQELACDHSVLAASNDEERLEYGRVLLKAIHSHALPTALSFFNNPKQRFIMLEKHKNSTFTTILGISLCAIITVFALTKAPDSIAKEAKNQQGVSFKFKDMPLKTILMLVADGMHKEVVGFHKLPDINISVSAKNVNASEFENLILKCTGFKLEPKEGYFEIMNDTKSKNNLKNSNQCINTLNEKKS